MRRISEPVPTHGILFMALGGAGLLLFSMSPATSAPIHGASVEGVVALVNAVPACGDYECEYCDEEQDEHELIEDENGSDDEAWPGQGDHECEEAETGCSSHKCFPEHAPVPAVDLGTFASLAPALRSLTGPQLELLLAQTQRVVINTKRRAIQVMGCQDEVYVSVNLSVDQESHLGSLD